MSKLAVALLSLASFVTASLSAAEPFIKFPTGNLSCTISIKPHGESASELPVKVDISRVDKMTYLAVTLSGGEVTEYWQSATLDLTLFLEPDSPTVKVRRGNDLLPPVLRLERDPTWYEWIGAGTFKGEVVYRGVPCRRFEKSFVVPSPTGDGTSTTVIHQAWIDAETLHPLAFDDGEARFQITFNGEPAPVTMPPLVERELKEYQALLSPARRR